MKKVSIILLLLSAFASCANLETSDLVTEVPDYNGRYRSFEEARFIAEQSVAFLKEGAKSNSRTIDDWYILDGESTKSGVSDTLLYVFNYADSAGFSLISANSSVVPIVAVTERGHLVPGSSSGVPGFDEYLDSVLVTLERLSPSAVIDGDFELSYYYVYTTVGDEVLPLLGQTRWGQTGVYGDFCPNGICGCFATALGQIMYIFSNPTQFCATCDMDVVYSEGDTVTLHWNQISNHYANHTSVKPCSDFHDEISAFLRDIGENASSEYRTDGTGTWTYNSEIVPTFQHYGYSSDALASANTTIMKTSLDSLRPVCMFSPGHFYVVDGYKDQVVTRYKYEQVIGDSGYTLTSSEIVEDIHAMHINWGWDGNCNGYFAFGTYNTANAEEYDTSVNTVAMDFTYGAQMVPNIHPANQ